MEQISPPPPKPQLEYKPRPHRLRTGLILLLIVFVAVGAFGIVTRAEDERKLKHKTQQSAVPTVAVITAQEAAKTEDVVLPGTVQAWHEAIVYARTPGYLKDWKVDIGAKVKQGDLLADIDAPDLDAQFRQAQADLNTAIANNNIAQLTAKRYVELRKTDSVAQQQADQAIATAAADQAAVESAKANLDHLQEEENFKQVTAPFDGTVTRRNVDVGALINGGNSGTVDATNSVVTGQDMFHIAQIDKLRVYVEVPENDSIAVKPDMEAELHFPEHPQQTFPAKLDRTADALDPTTRTLLVQLEVDNPEGVLLSGGYADVHIKIPSTGQVVILPVNALLFRDGMKVGLVGQDNHVSLKKVTIGRDYGKTVEIIDGLSPGDRVVINPPDSLEDGEEVKIVHKDQADDKSGKDAAGKNPAPQSDNPVKGKETDQTQDKSQESNK